MWGSGHQLNAELAVMWKSGQPNNFKGKDNCVYVRDGKMWDVPCDHSYEFVSQKIIAQGK